MIIPGTSAPFCFSVPPVVVARTHIFGGKWAGLVQVALVVAVGPPGRDCY